VAFTCWLSVCGPAGIPLKITRSGAVEMSGTNKVTWQTDDDDLQNAEIECSANFGDSVDCRYSETPSKSSLVSTAVFLAYLNDLVMLKLHHTVGQNLCCVARYDYCYQQNIFKYACLSLSIYEFTDLLFYTHKVLVVFFV